MRPSGHVPLTVGGEVRSAADAVARAKSPRFRAAYVHVPFCRHKCHYCDFYSFVDDQDRGEAFVRRLEEELAAAGSFLREPLETVFVGGGTPTMLPPVLLERMLRAIRRELPLRHDVEWTVEANPETVSEEIAATLVACGVTRVSLGAQSFDPALLAALERHHDPASVPRAVARLRSAGIRELNLDLIFGIPGSTLVQWREDLSRAIDLGPDHLSAYGLVYEPNTPLTVKLRKGMVTRLDEEIEAEQSIHAVDALAEAGYARYEISNWAKPGCECQHNLLYWENADWWAFGPSGSAHADGVRWKNVPRLSDWLEDGPFSPVQDVECLGEDTRAGEAFMLGLRLMRGIGRSRVTELLAMGERGGERAQAIKRHETTGLLVWRDDRLQLTARGLMVADSVLAELV